MPVQLEALKSSLEESQRLLTSNTQKAEQVSLLCHGHLIEHIEDARSALLTILHSI